MFAGGRRPLTNARLDELTLRVDRMIAAAGPLVRGGMRFAMFVLWLSPLLLGMHVSTLPRLEVEKRTEVLRALEHSRFTNLLLMFVGVRAVLTMIFYEDPVELADLGYSAGHQTRYERHTRQLTVLQTVPAPLESGVRLKEDRVDESGEHVTAREDVA